ncbi:Non-essential glycogen phosphorylase [Xylographa bjoerkii]|nr:Non-essential glycogen phosphorylase [Xylographa bjoerkii]MCJ1394539.1 Non-essential glycogen phosphorylase [Xylographa bjoerkii]
MASLNAFTYSHPLQGRNIRLLEVKLGPQLSPLKIRLVEKHLDEVEFEALSYVWGNQARKKSIKCNGCRLAIGSNLHDALCEMRRRGSTTFCWADAICINQNNAQEKTCQVRLMREIYARANRVIIWIGKEQPRDSDALQLAESLYKKCDGDWYDIDAGTYDFEDFDCESKGVPKPLFDPIWIALFEIISHPWFGRVWVIQELLVAQRSTMWRGALDFDTDTILWSAMQVGRHRNLYNSFDVTMNSPQTSALMARNVAASYLDYKKKGPHTLYDTLSRNSGMGATDSRDRFFALASVSTGLNLAFINYKKTFKEVACLVGMMTLLGFSEYDLEPGGTEMLTSSQIPQEHRFLIEWLAFHANPQNHKLGIPSWVPDLLSAHSTGLVMTGFYNTLYLQGVRDIPSPQVRLKKGPLDIRIEVSPNRWRIPVPDDIDIKGAIFDRVRIVARDRPRLPSPDSSATHVRMHLSLTAMERVAQYEAMMEKFAEYETAMIYWLSEIRLLADPTLNTRGDIMAGLSKSFDAFWRTLVYNREPHFNYDSPNQRPEAWLGVSFGYWYLSKKLQMAKRWRDKPANWAFHRRVLEKLAAPFEEAEGRVRYARNFFVSQEGRIGWVPFRTQAGDHVCVFYGMRIPVILRLQSDRWEFIGACYVHGLMDGEVWDLNGLQWDFMSFV